MDLNWVRKCWEAALDPDRAVGSGKWRSEDHINKELDNVFEECVEALLSARIEKHGNKVYAMVEII